MAYRETRQNSDRVVLKNREGVTEGRVEVQRVSFCQKRAPTCRGLNDIIQRSAAPQLKRKEMGECEA